MVFPKSPGQIPSFYFSKHYEISPIITVVSFVMVGMCMSIIHGCMFQEAAFTKTGSLHNEIELIKDPVDRKWIRLTPVQEKYKANPDLYQLYKDMRDKEEERRKECEGQE